MTSANGHENGNRRRMLSPQAVAEELDVTTAWVYAKIRAGELAAIRLGKFLKIDRAALEDFIAAHRVGR